MTFIKNITNLGPQAVSAVKQLELIILVALNNKQQIDLNDVTAYKVNYVYTLHTSPL